MQDPILESLFARPIERFHLENGLTVIHSPDAKAAVVSVQVWVKTGSIHEGQWLGSGISHYLEHMLFKGTARRTFKDISKEVQAHGGTINAYTTFDRTVYYIDGCTEALAVYLDVLADMVFHSTIDGEEAAREKNVILREIDMCNDDPDRTIAQMTFQESFRVHPYCYPVIGIRPLFEQLTHEDLLLYYRERYVPNNMVISIGGDVGACDVKEEIKKYFGGEAIRRLKPVYIPQEPEQIGHRVLRLQKDLQIARGSVTFQVPGMRHLDGPSLDLLAGIIGRGNSSVLWKRLHDELELVHEISANCWNPGELGMFWISYICDNGDEGEVEAAILKTLYELDGTAVDTAAVQKVLRGAVVSQVNSCKTASGTASRNASYEVIAGDVNFPFAYFERAFAQTAEGILAVAKKYFQKTRLSTVQLVGESAIGEGVQILEKTTVLPDVEEVVLANGVRVLYQQVKGLPKTSFKAVCLGGPVYEEAHEKGGCALLATLLARDTLNRSAYEVATAIESVGASFNEYAGNNTFGLSLEVLSDAIPLAVRTLSEALLKPKFDRRTFDNEREGQVAHIRENQDDALEHARLRLRELFFGQHPFRSDFLGGIDSLEAMSVKDLKGLYARLVVPSNLILAVSGDFQKDDVLKRLEDAFGGMEGKQFEKRTSQLQSQALAGFHGEKTDRKQTIVQCAFADSGIKGEDHFVGDVLDELFSGMSSALFENVRERRGLAYYVHSCRIIGLDCGMFGFCAGTTWEAHAEVLALIREEIDRVSRGDISPAELQRCKTRIKASRRIQQQSSASRAMSSALYSAYGQPINLWRSYDGIIDAIGVAEIARMVSRFKTENALTLVCSPSVTG